MQPTPPANRLLTPFRLAFCLALLFAVTMAILPHPPRLFSDAMGDKLNHMMAFATLTALAAGGWPTAPRWRVAERLSFLGALIEVLQAIPAVHRDCDIRDWIADTLAIVVVTGLVTLFRGHQGTGSAQ